MMTPVFLSIEKGGTTYYTLDGSDPKTSETRMAYNGEEIYISREDADQDEMDVIVHDDGTYELVETGRRSLLLRAYTASTKPSAQRDSGYAEYGEVPKRVADEQYSYAFSGWSPEIAAVIGDIIYTAVYEATPVEQTAKKHSLTFDFDDGTLDGKTSLVIVANVGDVITIPNAPTKDGYEFKYWKGSEYYPGDSYTVEDDHAFTAVWEQKASRSSEAGKKAETKGTSAQSPSAKTGDPIPLGVCLVLVMSSALALAVALTARSRKS